ncbi:MAG TPA: response regulator [Bdellovibrionales bacterium]|nr:response regulator [Bdellovibrionales bacterium]
MTNLKHELESNLVFVLLPTANDNNVACATLAEFGITSRAYNSIDSLCAAIENGCAAIVVAEEALDREAINCLQTILDRQETWSDLPIILLTGDSVQRAAELFSTATNISLLERPFSRMTLVRSVQVALRSRKKQIEVRDLLNDLKKSKADAEKANTAKTRFLANMSHEIRTPIGAIIGFIDLLKSHENSREDISKYMAIIDRNSHQLLRLIDDILDLSKVEAGKLVIEQIAFKLTDLLADLGSIMSFKAAEKGIVFRTIIETLIPDEIISDPGRIRQILSNIVGNAIKFTARGSVELRVAFKNGALEFLVADTGVGLTTSQAAKLFQPFVQADTTTSRRFGGTGLGLVLSRGLAQSMGGNLTLMESTEGQGSVFKIEIRADLTNETTLVGQSAIAIEDSFTAVRSEKGLLQGLRVLLVEDSPDNRMLITTYLSKQGALVDPASDGAEGVIAARKKQFDVVLMDVQMPNMDGHAATRALRAQCYDRPIIALTAHAMQEERLKCFESGFTDFLTKPIQPARLISVLTRYLKQSVVRDL